MPTCVDGHDSVATDYCDVCGASMETVAAQPVPAAPPVELKVCAACGAPFSGRFCESCGHDSALPAPEAPVVSAAVGWTAVVAADRDFYERVLAREGPDTVDFPAYFPERRIELHGTLLIGRRNPSQGIEPEIDLSIDPADRGVSTQHAVIRVKESGVTVTDLGSTNGTSLNGEEELLPKGMEAPLADGDRIHVGAWTTITIVRSAASPG